jgi:hypothetical protein
MSEITSKVKKVGSEVIDKAGEMVELGKYKARISSQKSEIEKLQRQIGKYVYDLYKEENEGEFFDSEILDTCHAIDATYDEIAILENKIDMIKGE